MTDDVGKALREKVKEEPFARLMGLRVLDIREGFARVEMTADAGMDNLFGMTHGGAIFSLIDEAFELASNSHGTVAVALNMNVSFIAAARPGDVLRAEARETARTRRTAHYSIAVHRDDGGLMATCSALVYRKDQSLPFLGDRSGEPVSP